MTGRPAFAAYRVVVVGAGVTGLLTAVECALAGHRVTLLDRGAIPNPAATSYDQHWAIRTLAPTDAYLSSRLAAARARWLELAALFGTRVFRPVGAVSALPEGRAAAALAVAAEAGVPAEVVAPDRLAPLAFPAGTIGVLEPDAGVLLAGRALRAAAGWLAGHPAVTLRPGAAVRAVDVAAGTVELADRSTVDGDLVLVAAGPWTTGLVPLPVLLHRQTMVHLRPPEHLRRWWATAPAAGRLGPDGRAWLVPPGGGAVLKVSTEDACRQVTGTGSPGRPAREWAAGVLAASPLSDVDSYTVVGVTECHYASDAENAGPLLARVGPGVWARAACGGSGFGEAPLVAAAMVRELASEAAAA
jgi:glycine/D-amino acid oxidase-like deaminating enzyme